MLRALLASGPLHLGVFIITTVLPAPSLGILGFFENPCGFDPKGAWPATAAFEAAFAGSPKYSLPLIGSGFNRTLDFDGFCNDILWKSSDFTSNDVNAQTQTGEWQATTKHQSPAILSFDHTNCQLKHVNVRKSGGAQAVGGEFEAQVKFEFEECSAAVGAPAGYVPPVKSAAVVMGLRKELYVGTARGSNLVPWMTETAHPTETTTPAQTGFSINTVYNQSEFGKGTCKASGDSRKVNVSTKIECGSQCQSAINEAGALCSTCSAQEKTKKEAEEGCAGYAFNAQAAVADRCVLYKGAVTALDHEDPNWVCVNMTVTEQKVAKSTAPPSPVASLPELTQNLHLREVMAGAPTSMTTAKLYQVESEDSRGLCFDGSWWFMIQDDFGNPASLPVKQAEWDAMMAFLPAPKAAPAPQKSKVLIDRVLVKTCNPDGGSWGRECVMPKVTSADNVCDNQQVVNAIVTGIVVPVFGWLAVYGFFTKFLPRWCMASDATRSFDHDTHDEGNLPNCILQGFLACCIVALISCAGLAFGSSAAVSYAFGAAGCLHGQREILVIACAAGIPGALAVFIGLLYLQFSGNKHKQTKALNQDAYVPPKGQKLMLVEVPDDGRRPLRGTPLNPDILQTGNSAMSSYQATSQPRSINISSMEADIGEYQPAPRPGGE